jgi:hypothetical protein
VFHDQTTRQNYYLREANKSFENVTKFIYLGTMVTNKNYFVFGRSQVQISAGKQPNLTEDFTQSLQENSGIEPKLGHDHFHPYPFQFIIQLLSLYLTLYIF